MIYKIQNERVTTYRKFDGIKANSNFFWTEMPPKSGGYLYYLLAIGIYILFGTFKLTEKIRQQNNSNEIVQIYDKI